jgi:hypothetical protein
MTQAESTLEIIDVLVSEGEGGRDLGYVIEALRRRRP